MRIMFQTRTTIFSVPGGDTTQILKTQEYLAKQGVTVAVSTELTPDVSCFDVVHLFNLLRPQDVLVQARNARRYNKPTALSTIHGDYSEYERKARTLPVRLLYRVMSNAGIEYLKTAARAVVSGERHEGARAYLRQGHVRSQCEILSLSDVLLPNSQSEADRVQREFPEALSKPYVVVPNAVDVGIFDPERVSVPRSLEQYQGCVLCVARIEVRKNQLNLVRAMKGLPWQLVIVGTPAPNHRAYYERVRREAPSNVHFLGRVEHPQLAQFYKTARVHCLISWCESTGLSSLEAGVMGCRLVITDKGDTRDYFGDRAIYCEPDSAMSIRQAIRTAYETPLPTDLASHIRTNFNWDQTAHMTLEGYRLALAQHADLPVKP